MFELGRLARTRLRRWRLALAPLLALVLVGVIGTAADAKIAPDSECPNPEPNYYHCKQPNFGPHGVSYIELSVQSNGDNTGISAIGIVYAAWGDGCINTCKYDVVAMTTSISGVPVRRLDPDGPNLNSDTGWPQRACTGSHTVWASVEWRILDGTTLQQGVYQTKNLTMHC